jgi:hypothetical protein
MKTKAVMVLFGICLLSMLYSQMPITDTNKVAQEYVRYYSNMGFSVGSVIVNNGYLPLLEYELHDVELAVLSKADLRILRNTIFAKYGLKFSSQDLKQHFAQFKWYKAKYTSVDTKLSSIDKLNIARIQAFENSVPNNQVSIRELYGAWQSFPVGSGDYNNITITDNNRIEFGYNTMYPQIAMTCAGTCSIENGYLVAYVTEQKLSVGEFFSGAYASVLGGMEGQMRTGTLKYDTPIRMVFPVGKENNMVRQIGSYERRRITE